MESFDLSSLWGCTTNISETHADSIKREIQQKGRKECRLRGHFHVTDDDMDDIVEQLVNKQNRIKYLDLGEEFFDASLGWSYSEDQEHWCVERNYLSDTGGRKLLWAVRRSPKLSHIRLDGNEISSGISASINEALMDNKEEKTKIKRGKRQITNKIRKIGEKFSDLELYMHE